MKRSSSLLTVLLAVATTRCAPEETVVADLPPRVANAPCSIDADCAPDQFCERTSCSEALGACQRKPLVCSPEPSPVCGCDRVNYWNDCLRQQSGVTASTSGECPVGTPPCGLSHAPCPTPRAVCALTVPRQEDCASPLPGRCWVLPPACPDGAPAGGDRPRPAPTTNMALCAEPDKCVDVCNAIRRGPAFNLPPDRACR